MQDNLERTVVICPDYVLYQNNYHTGVSVIFSPSGVKIEGPTVSEHQRTFSFESSVDDIISINCRWFQRVSPTLEYLKLALLYAFLVLTVKSFLYGLHIRLDI